MFPNQDLGIHVLVANFKTKVRVAVLYAKPGSSDDGITDAIDESLDSKNRYYKIVLAGDFNIDMGTERGREFYKIMDEIYYMPLRNNIAQYITRARTSIDAVFSTHSLRTCGLFDSVFSHHLPLYVQVPREKQDFVRPIHQKTTIQGWSVGPTNGILPHKLTWKVMMMMDIQCSIVSSRCPIDGRAAYMQLIIT
ncbi:ATP-dependent DNA helicase [Caerostris darwini]|uniref:ATP-dependent DNA helicase n=1 Tax=Caerostris darwini TaxID=1538125 RepID=A0AAV4V318_9ARAC|nr:ATP-dependent DNA helicase [Caerostris darwini]